MNQLAIAFDGDRKAYAPGETVRGRALWVLDTTPARIEVRLFWHTEGKGDTDLEVVGTEAIEGPGPAGETGFALALPDRPWSCSGRLVSIVWSLEIVALPGEVAQRFDITVGPDRREIVLDRIGA